MKNTLHCCNTTNNFYGRPGNIVKIKNTRSPDRHCYSNVHFLRKNVSKFDTESNESRGTILPICRNLSNKML